SCLVSGKWGEGIAQCVAQVGVFRSRSHQRLYLRITRAAGGEFGDNGIDCYQKSHFLVRRWERFASKLLGILPIRKVVANLPQRFQVDSPAIFLVHYLLPVGALAQWRERDRIVLACRTAARCLAWFLA